jgi:rfaE bifunctional protein kinase chain/domain
MIRYDSEMTADLSAPDEKKFLELLFRILKNEKPEAILFEDYNKGVLTEKVIHQLLTYANRHKLLTAVDPKHKNFMAYQGCTIFKPNLREVHTALGISTQPNTSDLIETAALIRKKISCEIVLITLGEHGIFYSKGKTSAIVKAHQREVADISGAGDTVISVATLGLLSGMDLRETAELANLAGGLVCEHAGVVPMNKTWLRKEATRVTS